MADLFRKYKSLYSSTAGTFSTGSGVTITPASVTGLPTDTEITLTFDRVNGSGAATPTLLERIIGTVSGSNFVTRTSPASGRGADTTTEQVHTSPVVEQIWNAKDLNDIVVGITTEHAQDGSHKQVTGLTNNTPITQKNSGGTAQNLIGRDSSNKTIIYDGNGNEQIILPTTASAVNEVTMTNAATGNAPSIAPSGNDTNIDLALQGKGTGMVKANASYGDITSDTDGATVTLDMSVSNKHKVTLGGNRTIAVSNVKTGQIFSLRLLQDGTGSRTVTWFSGISWAGGSAPTLTTTASKADEVIFVCTGANTYDGFVVGQNI